MADEFIWVVTDDTGSEQVPAEGTPKGDWGDELGGAAATIATKGITISTQVLEQRMAAFLRSLGHIFRRAEAEAQGAEPGAKSRLQLEEVELAVTISAEGEVKLVAGLKAGTEGAITLKFRRVDVG